VHKATVVLNSPSDDDNGMVTACALPLKTTCSVAGLEETVTADDACAPENADDRNENMRTDGETKDNEEPDLTNSCIDGRIDHYVIHLLRIQLANIKQKSQKEHKECGRNAVAKGQNRSRVATCFNDIFPSMVRLRNYAD
jgi:hypothetical protein